MRWRGASPRAVTLHALSPRSRADGIAAPTIVRAGASRGSALLVGNQLKLSVLIPESLQTNQLEKA